MSSLEIAAETHRPKEKLGQLGHGGGSRISATTGRGYACIGLHEPKIAANVGAVLRAAGCFGAALVAISGQRYKHAWTDTQKAWKHLPLLEVDSLESAVPHGCIGVAVELLEGAASLPAYVHPERAFYVFGGEDRTLGPDVLKWCRDRVQIPTAYCLNLAAAVNIVLYDRTAKRKR